MAKGDHSRMGTAVTEQGQNAQHGLNAVRANNDVMYGNMNNNYNYATQQDMADHNAVMQNYREFLGGASNYGLGGALKTYQNFADTGGFSPQDIQNIRARAVAPIRGVYSNARADVDRQRRLQHGYSPNATAAMAKMGRDQAYSTADASTNAEAMIAQLLQQGRLAGASGLSQTSLGARGQDESAIGGMNQAYGTAPGMSGTYGQQLLGAGNQALQGQELQNAIAKMIMEGRFNEAKIPGNWQSAMGNISSGIGVVGDALTLGVPKSIFGGRGGSGVSGVGTGSSGPF